MRKVLLSMLALCSMGVASAQMKDGVQARVYAYDLQQETTTKVVNEGTIASYVVTFKTNTAATSAVVSLKNANGVVSSVEATSNDSKNWTAEVDVTTLGADIVAGTYNWEVTVSAPAVESFTRISDDTNNSSFAFFRSFGVAVDKSPESDNFGRVYVTNNKGGNTAEAPENRNTNAGVYTFNQNLIAENNANAYSCPLVGDVSSSGESPKDLIVGPDGMLYMAVHAVSKTGVYVVSPNDFSYNNIFDGNRDETTGYLTDDNGNRMLNLPYAIGVYGIGDERVLYVVDDYGPGGGGVSCVNKYNIGEAETWTTTPSKISYAYSYGTTKNVRIYRSNCAIEPISTGGYWVTQHYGQNGGKASIPSLMYCDNNDICRFNLEGEGLSTGDASYQARQGGLAVLERTGVVAFSSNTNACFIKYSVNEDNTITVNNESFTLCNMGDQYRRSNSFDFDYAGNLYTVTANKEMLSVWAVPNSLMGDNTCTTPAKKALTIEITADDITTGVDNIAIDANAPVEYYNLQGVKVENPTKGIFIKKQGAKATKVVL